VEKETIGISETKKERFLSFEELRHECVDFTQHTFQGRTFSNIELRSGTAPILAD